MDPGLFFQEVLEGVCAVHRNVLTFSTFRVMLRTGIAQFVGSWVSESGYRLHIRRVCKDQALVDFLDPRVAPIGRPYIGGVPSIRMIAHYDNYYEDFRVDLWEESKGFILHLDHEYNYVLDSEQREALVPSISRYERDHFVTIRVTQSVTRSRWEHVGCTWRGFRFGRGQPVGNMPSERALTQVRSGLDDVRKLGLPACVWHLGS